MDLPMPAKSTNAPSPEEGVNDAGNAGEVHDGEVHESRQPIIAGVFVQINRGEHADRGGHREGDHHEVDRSEQGGPDSARMPRRGLSRRKSRESMGAAWTKR